MTVKAEDKSRWTDIERNSDTWWNWQVRHFYRQAEYYRALNVVQIGSLIVWGVFWLVHYCWGCESSFFCPFPLSHSLHPTFPHLPLWWRATQGKMKPNRGEKWNIDFSFFSFLFFLSSHISWGIFKFLVFHASSSLFFSPPCLQLSVITSHNSLHIRSAVLWWGLRRSRLFIKGNQVFEIEKVSVCVFLSEPCSSWPVPDDQEPGRFSKHPWCTGVGVQKRFVYLQHTSPVDSSLTLIHF